MNPSSKGNEVLRAENLSFAFDDATQPLIQGLNLSLNRSQALFLIGPGGMGKTTLLKILAGLYLPSSGEIWIEGAPLQKLGKKERLLVLKRVAMTFQRSGLFDSKTVLENLLFPLRELTSLNEDESHALAAKVLKEVELSGNESKYPYETSGGMQKRLGIARALVIQPEVILYDDPTAGLDPITSQHIAELILDVQQKKNTGTLIVTSDLDMALSVSRKYGSKIAFFFEGKIIESGTAEDILRSSHPVIYQFTRGLLEGPLSKREFVENISI